MVLSLSLVAVVMRVIPLSLGRTNFRSVGWAIRGVYAPDDPPYGTHCSRHALGSFRQHGIERKRGLAEDPILIRRLGEGERLARGAENLGQRADRIRKIRAPGDPGSAERIDDLAEERIRRALAPALGLYIDGR